MVVVIILIYLTWTQYTNPESAHHIFSTPSCDSVRIQLSFDEHSPEHSWLISHEDKCALINHFLKTIDYEETGKFFIREFVRAAIKDGTSDLEGIIEFYYQVFKPEAYNKPFNQEVWLTPVADQLKNPRAAMTHDLIRNHLRPGLSKEEILQLLGDPEYDGIQERLALPVPDSLDACKIKLTGDEERKQTEALRIWLQNAPRQPDTLLIYPIGWDMVDPIFLEIKLDGNGKAKSFAVAQG